MAESLPPPTLQSMFLGFSKLNAEPELNDGQTMTLQQSDIWMQQAKIFNKNITLTDTGKEFLKFK